MLNIRIITQRIYACTQYKEIEALLMSLSLGDDYRREIFAFDYIRNSRPVRNAISTKTEMHFIRNFYM